MIKLNQEISLRSYDISSGVPVNVGEVSTISSLTWGEKFLGYASFTINVLASESNLEILKEGYLIATGGSSSGIIEIVTITYDAIGNRVYQLKGRTLECLLERRVVPKTYDASGKSKNEILLDIINANCISPDVPERLMQNLYIGTIDVSDEVTTFQTQGDTVYDTILELLSEEESGFTMRFNLETSMIGIYITKGEDKTQGINAIELSVETDDIVFSQYYKSIKDEKNFIYAQATYKDNDKDIDKEIIIEYDKDVQSGYQRKEMFEDTSKVKSKVDDVQLTEQEFTDALLVYGKDELSQNALIEEIDTSIRQDNKGSYTYFEDFFLGDKVIVNNENLKLKLNVVVSEISFSIGTTNNFEVRFGTASSIEPIVTRRRRI